MKKLHLIAIMILLLCGSLLCAWDGFNYVVAHEYDSGIRVTWQVKDEQNVEFYRILRSRSDSDVLQERAQIAPQGDGALYAYEDKNLLPKSSDTGNYTYNYFVRAVMTDGTFTNSEKIEVTLTSLGVTQQTWGSIKAMFR